MFLRIVFLFVLFQPLWIFCQIPNGDFEDWPEVLDQSPYEEDLLGQGVENPKMAIPNDWGKHGSPFGVCRAENKCSGDFGLLLFSWYGGEKAFLEQTFSLKSKPQSLTGCYQYIYLDTTYDQAEKFAEIVLWSKGDTIGAAYFSFESSSEYTNFEVPISYTSTDMPDSMSILFYTDVLGSTNFPVDGLLYLDDLQLVDTATPTINGVGANDFDIYPNPFENNLFIDCKKLGHFYFELYDLKGQLFSKGALTKATNKLDIEFLPYGVYILNIVDDQNAMLIRKFIKV